MPIHRLADRNTQLGPIHPAGLPTWGNNPNQLAPAFGSAAGLPRKPSSRAAAPGPSRLEIAQPDRPPAGPTARAAPTLPE